MAQPPLLGTKTTSWEQDMLTLVNCNVRAQNRWQQKLAQDAKQKAK